MSSIVRIKVNNYRSLVNLSIEIDAINILFGPNGAGKSSFLDILCFVRDCAIRGIDLASSYRSHGIGILWDCAESGEPVSIMISTSEADYELSFGFSSGRIEPFVGEHLYSTIQKADLIRRNIGSDKVQFHHVRLQNVATVTLREPQKISLGRYLDFEEAAHEAVNLDRLLHFIRYYNSRSFSLHRIKQQGSEAGHETWLWERGENLWSVLRNLHDRKAVDNRYDTIMQFMAESFPAFDGLLIEQTGPSSVYGSFIEKGRRAPIRASGVSDGHLQMLLLLTALFAEGKQQESLMLLDEPEISLHPWALSVFAEAVKLAASDWNRQIFIATHSPVLISQFDLQHILSTELENGRTRMVRLEDMDDIRDLLEEYAAGSLYMANMIAAQGNPDTESGEAEKADATHC